VNEKAMKEKLFTQGMASVGSSPQDFAAFIRNDVASSIKIIKDVGIQPE
jgi:tripartite-type tricarboxylate transporter receptor subunit TctC